MQQQGDKAYDQLLTEYTNYRQSALADKEQLRRQLEKCKQQLEKLNAKLDRRVDARLKEERVVANHRIEDLEHQHQQQLDKINALIAQKDKVLDELRHHLRTSEAEKRELIHNHTKILVELGQGLEGKPEKQSQALDSNYRELLKMYQFLMGENNQLKKEIYSLRRNQLVAVGNESFLSREEKSLNASDYKPKSITDSSKAQPFTTNKSVVREKPKDKAKKPPLHKQPKK